MSKQLLVTYEAPDHGWLSLTVQSEGQSVFIDASDVPNNPMQELIGALEDASRGREVYVWWNLEPDGFFMYLCPGSNEVSLRIESAPNSERERGICVLEVTGTRQQVLLPLWRFVREFQSHGYQEPHWPVTDYGRMAEIKKNLEAPQDFK